MKTGSRALLISILVLAGCDANGSLGIPEAEVREDHIDKLQQVGLALHNFHDVHKEFPSAGAEPGLSWRVHLLPFVDHGSTYRAMNLEQSWDAKSNRFAVSAMPTVYFMKGATEDGRTPLHVFVGEQTIFGNAEGRAIRYIRDGTSNTLLAVVAGPSTADTWTRPGGLTPDPTAPLAPLNDAGEKFLVLFTDGNVKPISRDIDPQTFQGMLTIDGGEAIQYHFAQ